MNEDEKQPEYTEEEVRAAQAKISTHVSAAYAELNAAQEIADKYKLSFSFSPAYGMGGHYYGDPDDHSDYNEGGWHASSQSC
jgi:hypothetical protein